MIFNEKELIKSPLNYTGNKFNLLPQLFKLFPEQINSFIDVFGGSGIVGVNTNAKDIIYNDVNNKVSELIQYFYEKFTNEDLNTIHNIIKNNNLSKNNKETYYDFRERYNQSEIKHPLLLYILSCYSFNYNIRFNSEGNFNMPCGNRSFSKSMENNLKQFVEKSRQKTITFFDCDFELLFNDIQLNENDLVYFDPCYLPTAIVTTYGENKKWTIDDELRLYKLADKLNEQNIKFALSNVSYYRGVKNDTLLNWANKYNVHELDYTYKNNNCYKKDNEAKTQEVLITNY